MADNHRKLSDITTEKLRTMILSDYNKGDRIPTEEELTKIFSVSRMTIREAVGNLKAMGILEARQGDGTYIRQLTPLSCINPILPMLKLENFEIEDIYEVRILIEVRAAKSAAISEIPDKEKENLQSLMETMNQQAIDGDIYGYNKTDLEFHKQLVGCCGNKVLSTIHEMLLDLIETTIQKSCNTKDHLVSSIIFHNRILKAIETKNSEDAASSMEEHLNGGLNYIKENRKQVLNNKQ